MTRMNDKDEFKRAKSMACQYLAYKDRTREEIANYLAKKELPEPVISQTLDELTALGYLNDARFAANWARLRLNNKKFGKIRVLRELIDKGLDPQLAEKTLVQANSGAGERTGREAIHAYTGACEVAGRVARELDDSGLARPVGSGVVKLTVIHIGVGLR